MAEHESASEDELLARAADQAAHGENVALQATLNELANQARTVFTLRKMARELAGRGVPAKVIRPFYETGGELCRNLPTTIRFAEGFADLFDDAQRARRVLDEALGLCAHTKDCVQLAGGYRQALDDNNAIRVALDAAGAKACHCSDFSLLAEAYWKLLQDRAAAELAFEQAIETCTNARMLRTLGKAVESELCDVELAARAYSKGKRAESEEDGCGEL